MYKLTIEGKNLEEFKQAIADINQELNSTKEEEEIVVKPDIYNGSIKDTAIEQMQEDAQTNNPINPTMINNDESYVERCVQPVVQPPAQPVVQPPAQPVVQPPAQPVVSNGPVELDVEGVPWDYRIHTVRKTKMANGTWKIKRGTDRDYALQVKNEIRQNLVAQAPIQPTQPIQPAQPVAQEPAQPVAQAPAQPVAQEPAQPMVSNGHTLETFQENFPMVIGTLLTEGKIRPDYIESLKQYFGVAQIYEINNDQKAEMFNEFVKCKILTQMA